MHEISKVTIETLIQLIALCEGLIIQENSEIKVCWICRFFLLELNSDEFEHNYIGASTNLYIYIYIYMKSFGFVSLQ